MTQFHQIFQSYSKEKLFRMILFPADFQPEAVEVAKQIIKEKNWTKDFDKYMEEHAKKELEEQQLYEQEVKEKAEYYKNVVEFKNEGNSFQVRIADIPKFEAVLNEAEIEFFREDKNIGVQLDQYPTQTYYFKNEDNDKVDELVKELGLVTAPYADIKPFFGFQIKALLVIVVLSIIAFFIMKMLES